MKIVDTTTSRVAYGTPPAHYSGWVIRCPKCSHRGALELMGRKHKRNGFAVVYCAHCKKLRKEVHNVR